MEAGVRASRTALKIFYKSSSEYLGTLVATTGALAAGGFVPEGPAGWSDNWSPDSGGGEESEGETERTTEGAIEGCFRWGRPRFWTEIILALTF